VFVVGHHNAHICRPNGDMPRLSRLMESYNVSGYFFGHVHSLGYAKSANTAYILSGSGGKRQPNCNTKGWGSSEMGFTSITVNSTHFQIDYLNNKNKILYSQFGLPRQIQ
jgi:predicted phosphodiesterase